MRPIVVLPAPTTPITITIMVADCGFILSRRLDLERGGETPPRQPPGRRRYLCSPHYRFEYVFSCPVRAFVTVNEPSICAETLRYFPSQFSFTLAIRSSATL